MAAHYFKLDKVPLFAREISEYQYFTVCCIETRSCASKPLLLRCKLVIPKCLCHVSLGLKEVQMGAHDFELNKVSFGSKASEYQCFKVCCPETSSCASNRYDCDISIHM